MMWISTLFKKPATQPSAPSRPAPAARAGGNAGRVNPAPTAATPAPQAGDSPEAWVAAICQAPDQALALAWAENLSGDAWLAEVAMRARSAEVRFACVQRIGTTALLEQVAQASRDKDKRVYRHCAELLRQRRQADASSRRALEMAAELHGLLAAATALPLSRLLDLKRELGALGDAGEPGRECDALLQQALARVRQESEARRDLQQQQSAAVALAAECACAAWPWSEQIAAWRARHDALSQARTGLPAWLAEQPAAQALGESLRAIGSRLAELAADDERVVACEQFLAALAADRLTDAETAAWDALAKPADAAARQAIDSRWQALSARVPPAAASEAAAPAPLRPRAQARVDHDAVRELLDKLEQAIVEGHLVDADTAARQIKDTLAGNSLHGALESRLHGLQAQLEALRGWARWGTGQAREQLVAAARELLNGERGVDELARAIPALREEWKRLNAHGAAAKGQWESFDAALEQAYQPLAAQRAEQAAHQAETRAAKQALCVEWEAEVAGIAWEQADFKVVEARRAEMIKQWRALPLAGFADERNLRKRFDPLIGGIDQRLDAARAAECERREQLIAAAEALHDRSDLRQAMSEARALQERWTREGQPVRLKRGDEVKLWQRFRTACNAVFERHAGLRAEQTAQRQERAQSRRNLLDAFAATLAGADAEEIKRAVIQFRADWGATRPAARESGDSLETRARDLQQQAQQRLDELRNQKYRARFDLLAQRAALAEGIEAAALAGAPLEAVVAEAKQAWDGLPRLPGKAESLLAGRFAAAGSVTHAALAAGRETREALLLDLEIALGLPSPETCAGIRRERQLEQLQNRFGGAAPNLSEPEALLARWYATAALPDAASERRIAAVVRQLAQQAAAASGR